MTKDEARALIREKKKTLTAEYRAQANAEIATRFLCYPIFQQVDSIFCYVNTEDEPSTREIIETAWQMGKLVTVPRCIPGPAHRMEAVQIMSWDDLVPGAYGLLEPKEGLPVVDAAAMTATLQAMVDDLLRGYRWTLLTMITLNVATVLTSLAALRATTRRVRAAVSPGDPTAGR